MAHVSFDLIQETSASTNGASLTLAGATTGNRTFGSKMVNGDTCLAMASNGAGLFQAATYTWTTGGILTTVAGSVIDGSSGAGVVVTFTGTVTITLSPLAKKTGQFDNNGGMLFTAVTTDPATPPAGSLQVFSKELAGGRGMLKMLNSAGIDHWLQPAIFNNKVFLYNPYGNSTSSPREFGFTAPTIVGTLTARNAATTNLLTRARRLGLVSVATAGGLSSYYWASSAQWTLGVPQTAPVPHWGGFFSCWRWGVSDASVQTVARQFIGMSSSVAAPTNVEPSTLTNSIGVGKDAADTNYKIFYGGSAAQTAINLGASFPCNNNTDLYEMYLYAPPNVNNIVYYRVVNVSTGASVNGTLTGTAGTALPSNTTLLAPRAWRTNNSAAVAIGLDIASIYIETDN